MLATRAIPFLPLHVLIRSSVQSARNTSYSIFLNQCQLQCTGNNAALNLLQLLDRYSKPIAAAAKKQTLAVPVLPPAGAMSRLMLVIETLDNLLQ